MLAGSAVLGAWLWTDGLPAIACVLLPTASALCAGALQCVAWLWLEVLPGALTALAGAM